MAMSAEKFKELLAKARARNAANNISSTDLKSEGATLVELPPHISGASEDAKTEFVADIIAQDAVANLDKIGVARKVTLNEKQRLFCDTVLAGGNVVLVGAAGTGKTTSCRKTTEEMIDSEKYGKIDVATKWLKIGAPGIVVCSYTRKAVSNIRRAVDERLRANTQTIHKLLEYKPQFYEIPDTNATSGFRKTMRFEPSRNRENPLPPCIKAVFIEESSMVPVELWELFKEAMPHDWQEIFLGDIQQLPPVFGLAILGFKMVEHTVVELTEVYRQALKSPIITLAWKLLDGNPHVFDSALLTHQVNGKSRKYCPALDALSKDAGEDGSVKFQIFQKKLTADHAIMAVSKQLEVWIRDGYYNPLDDIILCPFKKPGTFGTTDLNLHIAQYLGEQRTALVHHVIAGFNSFYLAVGDRILYDKEDCYITSIKANPLYMGKLPAPASFAMNRDGSMRREATNTERLMSETSDEDAEGLSMDEMEAIMEAVADEVEERVQAASHIVHLRYAYNVEDSSNIEDTSEMEEQEAKEQIDIILSSASEVNDIMGGYAITVHAMQGSEAGKVFLFLHNSHAMMISRELLYTAVTRARKHLHILCEPETFYKGIMSQAVKGNTIAEKATFFKGRKLAEVRFKKEQAA